MYSRAHALSLVLLCIQTLCLAESPDTASVCAADAGAQLPPMVRIPSTTFWMGSPITDTESFAYRLGDLPHEQVTVDEFRIGRFLVTAEEFCEFLNDVGNDGYFIESYSVYDWRTIKKVGNTFVPQEAADRCPAYPVTWYGASGYCEWLSQRLCRKFRLPSELEWEAAARGGEGRTWPWGNETPVHAAMEHTAIKLPQSFDDAGELGPFPSFRRRARDEIIPFYHLKGLRWCEVPWDENRPWTKVPVGSFPFNATPEKVYDLVGYYSGQWCSDQRQPQVGAGDGRAEYPNGTLRAVRGMYQVPVDNSIPRRTNPLRFLLGDASRPQYTPGRVWSRMGLKPSEGAMFRVVQDP